MSKIFFYAHALAFLILLGIRDADAQNVKLVADKDTIAIGEPIHIKLSAANINAADFAVKKKFELADTAKKIELIHTGPIDSAISNGFIEYKQLLTITFFTEGEQLIPSYVVVFKNKKFNNYVKINTAPILIYVRPTDVSALTDYHGVRAAIPVPLVSSNTKNDDANIWGMVSIMVLIAVVILLTIKIWFNKKKKYRAGDAFKQANAKLDLLMLKCKKGINDGKILHQELYRIINDSFSKEFNSDIQYLTSEEWINHCRLLPISQKLQAELYSLINQIDAIRFGKNEAAEMNPTIIADTKTLFSKLYQVTKTSVANHAVKLDI